MNSIIIFDICGTLYNSNTTMDFCEWRETSLFKKHVLRASKSNIGKLLNRFCQIIAGVDYIRYLHIKFLKGVSIQRLDKEADLFVENFLRSKKNQIVHEIFKNQNKQECVLASATIQPVAKAISQRLGVEKYYATKLHKNDKDICLGKIKFDLLNKKQLLFEGVPIDLVVTDNFADYELCLQAKNAIVVAKKKSVKRWKQKNIPNLKIIQV